MGGHGVERKNAHELVNVDNCTGRTAELVGTRTVGPVGAHTLELGARTVEPARTHTVEPVGTRTVGPVGDHTFELVGAHSAEQELVSARTVEVVSAYDIEAGMDHHSRVCQA